MHQAIIYFIFGLHTPDEQPEYQREADHGVNTRSDDPTSGHAAGITGVEGVASVTKWRHILCLKGASRATIGRPGRVFEKELSSVLHIWEWNDGRRAIKSNRVGCG